MTSVPLTEKRGMIGVSPVMLVVVGFTGTAAVYVIDPIVVAAGRKLTVSLTGVPALSPFGVKVA